MERRKYSTQFKQQIVNECAETSNVALVARKHELNVSIVRRWIRQANQDGGKIAGKARGVATHVTPDEFRQLHSEREQLVSENEKMKKALGEQALEIAILRDLLKKANHHLRIK